MRFESLTGDATERGETLVQVGLSPRQLTSGCNQRRLPLHHEEHGRRAGLESALLARILLFGKVADIDGRRGAGTQ